VLVLVVGHVRTPCGRIVQRQYRSISRREYYRLAKAERDTTGRPSCRTDAGRTVYGGGGIYPDVPLTDRAPLPRWVNRVYEQQLPIAWSGGYVDAHASSLASIDAFVAAELPPVVLADFRTFASKQGVVVPADGDAVLQDVLLQSIAYARWGSEGTYRVVAQRDRAVREATAAFDRASALLGGGR
jgi:carboxyl-terminal processing protease